MQAPGKTEEELVENAFDKVDKVIADINAFYADDWAKYQKSVEAQNLSPFKSYEELK